MDFFELARRWTILFLAQMLSTSARAIEIVLPLRPRWLAQIRLLETELRAAANRHRAQPEPGQAVVRNDSPEPDLGALLASYNVLQQTVVDLEARGRSLDDGLLNRMKAEWTAESIVGYLQSCETQLRKTVSEALDQAAVPLAAGAEVVNAIRPPVPEPEPEPERPEKTPSRPTAGAMAKRGAGRIEGRSR